ncbi:ShlB/FhaC/HecB family hemolysin secretion/activation protein [Marinobacter confluentis]|uniref:Haemolysin activator HlyB C-terminal domain-containing protein n=1 Tax=Marinobacter confluentis TaxID=1697557 RepID=A0A4Z1BVR8_9GAMM|nr:ShlB/FhaC/HecB family hemolysin secretion/activation protein [Marinobacter confluentis]TGN41499.1 hypothetical protein E5Q11_02900 [Marinobacter confluentis]
MKLTLLFALIWCAISQSLYAGQDTSWLKFSGKTELDNVGRHGSVGLAADRLLGQSDAIGFSYRDARSYRNETDSSAASFRYRLPAGLNQVQVEAGRSRYDHAVSSGSLRFNASGESRVIGLGATRPLFSRFGVSFDGIARHRGLDSESFERDAKVSESRYQLSSFGVEANCGRELMAGLLFSSRVLALSGREFSSTDYPLHDDFTDESAFYKVAVSASLEREVFHWNWTANGRYQFADEDLPSSEYLTVAGPSLFSGFNGQSVSVIEGGWLRLGTASPTWPMPFLDGVVSSVNVAVLQGWIPYSLAQAYSHGKASAGQISVKMQGRAFTANVSVGRMIGVSTMAMTMPDHPDVRFSLSVGI